MISYGRNSEDVVLARLFESVEGFYVDVGAGHPLVGSVTKHFSERGWHGLNVERRADVHALLRADRPRDRNVLACVADHTGAEVLDTATVRSLRLMDLLSSEGVEHIDFLKLAIDGAEGAVISDTGWTVVRPRVLVVEAARPGEPTPAHEDWEPTLRAAGYVCTLFDGLNRFYAQARDQAAIAALSVPANVHDDVLPYKWLEQVRFLEEELQPERTARSGLALLGHELAAVAEEARRLARQADPGAQLLADPA